MDFIRWPNFPKMLGIIGKPFTFVGNLVTISGNLVIFRKLGHNFGKLEFLIPTYHKGYHKFWEIWVTFLGNWVTIWGNQVTFFGFKVKFSGMQDTFSVNWVTFWETSSDPPFSWMSGHFRDEILYSANMVSFKICSNFFFFVYVI